MEKRALLSFNNFSRIQAVHLILRMGLAFAFLYPAIDAIFDAPSWIGYLPHFVRGFVPALVVLHVFGAIEVIIALWVLSGKKIIYPLIAALIILLVIVSLNFSLFEVVFRDLSIAAIALALIFFPEPSSFKKGTVTSEVLE